MSDNPFAAAKSPTNKGYTFADFFAKKKKQQPAGATGAPQSTLSPLLAATASSQSPSPVKAKKQRPGAEPRAEEDTPGTSPDTESPHLQRSRMGGSPGGSSVPAVPSARSSGGAAAAPAGGDKATKLLSAAAQDNVKKRRADFLRQTQNGLGFKPKATLRSSARASAARSSAPIGSKARPAKLELSDSDDDGSRLSKRPRVQSARPSLFGQNARQQAAARPAVRAAGPPTAAAATQVSARSATAGENHRFYLNLRKSAPDGEYIDQMHAVWRSQYSKLEKHHSYIQWLFPVYGE